MGKLSVGVEAGIEVLVKSLSSCVSLKFKQEDSKRGTEQCGGTTGGSQPASDLPCERHALAAAWGGQIRTRTERTVMQLARRGDGSVGGGPAETRRGRLRASRGRASRTETWERDGGGLNKKTPSAGSASPAWLWVLAF